MKIKKSDYEFSFDDSACPEFPDNNEDTKFSSVDFSKYNIAGCLFENCFFESCRFNEITLNKCTFNSCVFSECEIVLTKFANTTLNEAAFLNCKLTGVNLSDCNDFGLSLEFNGSILDYVVISGKKLKKTDFTACRINNSDFTDIDFKESDFSETIFENTAFRNCNLEKCDFRTSSGYEIDPALNVIRNARFTLPEAQSFLLFLGIKIDYQ